MILNCLDIIITNNCNFRCSYCTLPQIHSKDQDIFIKKELAFVAIDTFFKTISKKVTVHFFGGEPLLNFPLLKEIGEYAIKRAKKSSKKLTLSIATNGSILSNEIIEYLIKNNFDILYSIDGDQDLHNTNRQFANKTDSYEVVIKNAETLLKNIKRKEKILGRATLTTYDIDIWRISTTLSEIGFKYIQIEPSFVPENSPLVVKTEHISLIKENLINFAKNYAEMFKREKNPFVFLPIGFFLSKITNRQFSNYWCEYAKTSVVINTDGKIYPCHRFTHISSLGSEMSEMHSSEKLRPFRERTSDTIKKCDTCWLKYYCGGTCYHHSYIYNNDIYSPYILDCKYVEELFKASILTYSLLEKDNISRFIKLLDTFYYRNE